MAAPVQPLDYETPEKPDPALARLLLAVAWVGFCMAGGLAGGVAGMIALHRKIPDEWWTLLPKHALAGGTLAAVLLVPILLVDRPAAPIKVALGALAATAASFTLAYLQLLG